MAPTPSGYLHQGNGFSFLLTWLLTRLAGGRLLLRIDDADTTRARPEFIEDIFRSLEWLGLDWDEGPQGPEDFKKNYSQQLRFSLYQELLEVLLQQGVLYACNCSRNQIRNNFADGIYRGSCRHRSIPFGSDGTAWRVSVPEHNICFREAGKGQQCLPLATQMGDFVVRRREGLAAYQIASLADDIAMGINFIVRGEDLFFSTAAQVYLAQLLTFVKQPQELSQGGVKFTEALFLHHPLVLDPQGNKLSKSAGSTSMKSLRESGGSPMPVYTRVASFLGLAPEAAASLQDLLAAGRGVGNFE